MANFAGKFISAKQEWVTPQNLFDRLHKEFKFTIDLAADSHNRKCRQYISKNALEISWSGRGWLNPPYGDGKNRLGKWVEKAFKETTKGNSKLVVMLIPARTNTDWWHKYCMRSCEIRFLQGRPKFGGAEYGLPQPLALVIFRKQRCHTRIGTFKV